jgi:hypothetical protein
MTLHQRDEGRGLEARQRGEAEARIIREEVFPARVDVGEVAAAAAGDADFLARLFGMVDDEDTAPSPARRQRAEKTSAARANDDGIVCQ